MFMVSSFSNCIARPKTDFRQRQLLKDHLIEVAKSAGNKEGMPIEQLAYLAGLCHDFGKSDYRWQKYIIAIEKKQKARSVPHAQVSSCIFFFLGLNLVKYLANNNEDQLKALENEVVKYCLDIADHHGELSDISVYDEPWQGRVLILDNVILPYTDTHGFLEFISEEIPLLKNTKADFENWFDFGDNAAAVWEEKAYSLVTSYQEDLNIFDTARKILRVNTSKLILGDRLSASKSKEEESKLLPEIAKEASENITLYCKEKAKGFKILGGQSKNLNAERNKSQEDSLSVYLEKREDARFFSLELPTGYGKTITSLRIALEAIINGDAERIIYVAPYISILSQVTEEIKEATKITNVLQHHHMSTYKLIANYSEIEPEIDNSKDADLLDSWQAPIVTTTFVQLFRALFPRRAQHTMRIFSMRHSFIIIDEPQTIEPSQWYLFITVLNELAEELDSKVLLVTATLPQCLPQQEITRIRPPVRQFSRYQIAYHPVQMEVDQLSDIVIESWKEGKNVALIVNTIGDCFQLYKSVIDKLEITNNPQEKGLYCLSGLMTSVHKKIIIEKIGFSLKHIPTLVICTQVLEAGVDLSFDVIYRIIAPIPSIIQAAGRLNRHGENQMGTLHVIEFVRDNKKDSSVYVYGKTDLSVTRDIINDVMEWPEEESLYMSQRFFSDSYNLAPRTGTLEKLTAALKGKWTDLGGLEPYSNTQPTTSVFVEKYAEELLKDDMRNVSEYFSINNISDIWLKYLDQDFTNKLSFADKKAFTSLLQLFSVPFPTKFLLHTNAIEIHRDKGFVKLINSERYSDETGLMGFTGENDFDERTY